MNRWRGAVAGLLAGVTGVAVAQLLAALLRPEASPLVAVGGAVIDATPTPVKEFAVRTFGTADKPILLGTLGLALAVLAAVAGHLATRRRPVGLAAIGLIGVVGVAAALTRPTARPWDAVPSIVGGLAAVGALLLLLRERGEPGDRRAFLKTSAGVAVGAGLAAIGATVLSRVRDSRADRARQALTLPAAADPAPPAPAGLRPGFYTENRDFYRVDTALTVPSIDPYDWRLRIHGMVDRPVELTLDELLARPLIERDITLNCVSNEVGGPYVGTARWLGVPLAPLLREAGIRGGVDQVVARSVEGMTIGTPLDVVLDGRDTMLAVGMNGAPLPADHGFPVRMLTPGLYGYVGACKWIVDIELSTFDSFDAYWVRRGWAPKAPVKTASRVDAPKPFEKVPAGPVMVAGVAWAQRRGIDRVEVRVDEGPWVAARLTPVPSIDTWVQWTYRWDATKGDHLVQVRATDKTGATQPENRVGTFPDGATGWHSVSLTVT